MFYLQNLIFYLKKLYLLLFNRKYWKSSRIKRVKLSYVYFKSYEMKCLQTCIINLVVFHYNCNAYKSRKYEYKILLYIFTFTVQYSILFIIYSTAMSKHDTVLYSTV